jgi:hypothetical protein
MAIKRAIISGIRSALRAVIKHSIDLNCLYAHSDYPPAKNFYILFTLCVHKFSFRSQDYRRAAFEWSIKFHITITIVFIVYQILMLHEKRIESAKRNYY